MIYLECIPKIFSFVPKTKDLTAYDRPNLDKIHNGTDVARQSDYRVRCTPSRQNNNGQGNAARPRRCAVA